MHRTSLPIFVVALFCLSSGPAVGEQENSANTLRLGPDAKPGAAKISDLAWLAGYWTGEGLGGGTEELWMPPMADRMHGVFTLAREGEIVFSELMLLVEQEGSLVLRVKHFDREFVGWEEKDGFVSFLLVRLGDNEAYFNGLTIRREGDDLTIYLVLVSGGERTEQALRMTRKSL